MGGVEISMQVSLTGDLGDPTCPVPAGPSESGHAVRGGHRPL